LDFSIIIFTKFSSYACVFVNPSAEIVIDISIIAILDKCISYIIFLADCLMVKLPDYFGAKITDVIHLFRLSRIDFVTFLLKCLLFAFHKMSEDLEALVDG
jgi:hypothetical protein